MNFWQYKLDKNIERDKRQQNKLKKLGWKYLVIWQCEANRMDPLQKKIRIFLDKK
jgi:DNA mismatch endonuclease (patch repair protein)